jgi:hypothetical protein
VKLDITSWICLFAIAAGAFWVAVRTLRIGREEKLREQLVELVKNPETAVRLAAHERAVNPRLTAAESYGRAIDRLRDDRRR